MLFLALIPPSLSNANDELFPPAEYIQTKIKQNEIVFLGTTHKKPRILKFIAELIPTLKKYEVSHISLEIPSDQQEKIDTYMETGNGLDDIQFHVQIDCPEYRKLLQVLRDNGDPTPVAIDLPRSMYDGDISRDEWMASQILKVLDSEPAAKILVIIGNLHIFKKLEWQEHVPNKHLSIREYIQLEKPSIKMFSIGQVIDAKVDECDFTQVFSQIPGAVALDLNMLCSGWKFSLTASIAIIPAEPFELLDGMIVY